MKIHWPSSNLGCLGFEVGDIYFDFYLTKGGFPVAMSAQNNLTQMRWRWSIGTGLVETSGPEVHRPHGDDSSRRQPSPLHQMSRHPDHREDQMIPITNKIYEELDAPTPRMCECCHPNEQTSRLAIGTRVFYLCNSCYTFTVNLIAEYKGQ